MAAEPPTVLIAARDEEERIAESIAALRQAFPGAEVIVADDGSRDATAVRAEEAGARVLRLPRRGKGQALTLGEREARPGAILLCDADLQGDLRPLTESTADVAVAAFPARRGGGFGLARGVARRLIRAVGGIDTSEPLSGQRRLTAGAREVCFPVAAGFGVETRMTIDAARAGLTVEEIDLELRHRETGRDLRGFVHRGRQLTDLLLAVGPQGTSFRGLRLPIVGWVVGVAAPEVAAATAIGLADDLWSGPERGFAAHLRGGVTTGTLKLAGIPLWALLRTRSVSGAILVGLAANAVNQLDTRPGRALKAYVLGSTLLQGGSDRGLAIAVLLAPYDLREMAMLGDAGANGLGALLGLRSVGRLTGRRRWCAIGALATLITLGERRSLGQLIETTPGLRDLDALGRFP